MLALSPYAVHAADNDFSGSGPAQEEVASASTTAAASAEKIKKIKEEEQKAKEELQQEEQELREVKREAEQILQEKEDLSKEAELKEKEAEILKEEIQVLKKEAKVSERPELKKEITQLEDEAAKIEEESRLQRQKIKLAETRASLARQKLEEQKNQIAGLEKDLQQLKVQRAGTQSLIEKAIRSLVLVLIGLLLFLLLRYGMRTLEKVMSKKTEIRESELTLRIRTLSKLVNWLGGIIIVISITYMILETHGYDVAPLIAGAGIIGLAFGFGGQYLIRDLINGLFILLEDQYRINDVIKIGDLGGLVEGINLRITTLRDLAGRVIIIPNGEIKTVINFTKGYAQALMDIGVAYKENVDRVIQIIKDMGAEMRQDPYFKRLILDDLEMLGVDDFADSAVVIKFRIKTLPIKQWEVMREFRRRIKNKFDEVGIEIPFPHRTMYWGTGKDNEWMKTAAGNFSAARDEKNS
jgi:small conductance mechanosensitive channel